MATIKPFKAVRPKEELAKQVASRPYDVLNSDEARSEAGGNPFSFLHITKSEIDLPPGIDTHSTEVYNRAKENLQQFISNGVLFKEEKACYYIYQLIMNGRSQTGLVCVSSVADYFRRAGWRRIGRSSGHFPLRATHRGAPDDFPEVAGLGV